MPRNRHLARALTAPLVACALLVPAAAASAASPCPDADITPSSANDTQVRNATLCLLNQERTNRGLAPLKSNAYLLKASRSFSRLMVSQGFFAHVSPGGSTLVTRVRKGTRYLRGAHDWMLGENLGWGSGALATPASRVSEWMLSPPHRKNILTPGFRHIGIGIALGAPVATGLRAATYTTDFGRRS
jgi:uncharacterized protein YkwD